MEVISLGITDKGRLAEMWSNLSSTERAVPTAIKAYHEVGRLWLGIKAKVSRPSQVTVFKQALQRGISKDERAACAKLAACPLESLLEKGKGLNLVSARALANKLCSESSKSSEGEGSESKRKAKKAAADKALKRALTAVKTLESCREQLPSRKLKIVSNLLAGLAEDYEA